MTYDRCHRIAQLMCEASLSILWPHSQAWVRHRSPGAVLTARVGRGNNTYCQIRRHGRFTLNYGVGMVRSKLSGYDCVSWTTSIEIHERGYFSGRITPLNLFAATCLHEYAHLIDHVRQGAHGLVEGRHHGQSFYAVLDRMHRHPIARRVHEFLTQRFETDGLPCLFDNGVAEVTESLAVRSRRFRPGQRVSVALSDDRQVEGTVKRINRRTVTVLVPDGGRVDKYLVSANYLRPIVGR